MLLVFGAAAAGVLVEAFVPARAAPGDAHRAGARRPGGRVRAHGRAGRHELDLRPRQPGAVAAVSAVAVDGPTLFIQGTILVLAFVSVLLIAESSHEVSAFTAAGGGGARQRGGARGPAGRHHAHRGLPADAVRGRRHAAVPRRERPADHVRRAGGAVAAAVPAVRAGPAPPAALAGSGHEVLPARRVLVGVLPVRRRDAVRLLRLGAAVRDRATAQSATASSDPAVRRASRCSASACCSRSARCRSRPGSRTSTRARPRRSRR